MPRSAARSSTPAARGAARRPRGAGIGLALAGGGFLGAAYELGVLAALDEALPGLDLNALDAYVGVSAGSFIAAGLANGKTPHQMVRMFVEDAEAALDPATMLRPSAKLWLRALRSAPRAFGQALEAGVSEGLRGPRAVAWQALERIGRLLPAGFLDTGPAERTLQALFSEAGRSDDFRALPTALRIVAADIDTGDPVEFGAPGFDHVPISRAVLASSALPGLFPPVEIDGRYYVDGALNKTLHASVALDEGVSLVLCVNPLVPYRGAAGRDAGAIAHAGLPIILSQSVRAAIRSRMGVGLQKYSVTHPHAKIVLFEPRGDDAGIFFTRIFTVASRRRVCEHAYQQTRADLLARHDELTDALAPFGLWLNRAVLEDRTLTLVRTAPPPLPMRAGGLEDSTLRLRHALDDLERALKVSVAA
ncbi:MAG TPA: patatin-like phospholipase family protein [Quisquiliibacterium sp.]|nr:patatin-like phospholipase family protein [Quisquiliibacterium sp.]